MHGITITLQDAWHYNYITCMILQHAHIYDTYVHMYHTCVHMYDTYVQHVGAYAYIIHLAFANGEDYRIPCRTEGSPDQGCHRGLPAGLVCEPAPATADNQRHIHHWPRLWPECQIHRWDMTPFTTRTSNFSSLHVHPTSPHYTYIQLLLTTRTVHWFLGFIL